MNDKELADKVVAILGTATVADWDQPVVIQDNGAWMGVVPYVRDWRVAGALMEKLESYDGFLLQQSGDDAGMCRVEVAGGTGINGNMCRAIIEACVEALELVLGKQK